MKHHLLFIFCFVGTVINKPTDYPSSNENPWKKFLYPTPPTTSIFCFDGSGKLFKEYLEQEKYLLQNRLNHISLLISESYYNPCAIYPIYLRHPIPYVDYNQFIDKNDIVIDKSSGKNLHIKLNLTDFAENDIEFEIIESRIVVEAQQQAEPHNYVKWTYLLPIGTNPSTIKHCFDNGYMTIEGTLSKDVNSFSSQQTLKTSIKHKASTSFTHLRNYPYVFSSGKSWYHAKK